ncbi:hypothetical protein KJZ61_03160 [Candidatus Dependentiae bacterium]|nr:hypothetical protein [Candidatus Dependentiae bacterium]
MLYKNKWMIYGLVFLKIVVSGSMIMTMPRHKKALSNDTIVLEQAQKDRAMQQLKIDLAELMLPIRHRECTNANKLALWEEYEKNNSKMLRAILEASQSILKCLTYSREVHADVARAEIRARDCATAFFRVASNDLADQLLKTDDMDSQALSRRTFEFVDHYRRGVLDFENNRDYQFTYNTDDDKKILQEIITNKDSYSQQAYNLAVALLAMVDIYESEGEVYRKKKLMNDFVNTLVVSTQQYCATVSISKCQGLLTYMVSQYFDCLMRDSLSSSDKECIEKLERSFAEHLIQVNLAIEEFQRQDAERKHKKEQAATTKLATMQNKKKRNKKDKTRDVSVADNVIVQQSHGAPSNSERASCSGEEPLVVREGCIGFSCDTAQRLFILGEQILSMGKHKEKQAANESSIPTLLSILRVQPPITNYARSTVMDWFENPKKALQREMAIPEYMHANATDEQRQQNIIAHTFPFQIDAFIEKLAIKSRGDDGSMRYVIPGAVYPRTPNVEWIGYFTWIVSQDGCCIHRSFTISPLTSRKDWMHRDNLIQRALCSKENIRDVLAQERDGVVDRGNVTARCDGAVEVKTNGLTVTVDHIPSGSSYKLIIAKGV